MTDRLIPGQSREASKKLEHNFKRSGIDVLTSSTVESLNGAGSVTVKISGGKIIEAEKALVSIGRVPNIKGLDLEGAGIKTHNGKICVNEYLATDIPNIYAVGDCVQGPQLAHKASYDGMLACDNILGKSRKVDYSNIPNCIWTEPEIASVGLSEEAARAMRQDIKVAKFPYLASGKAYLEGETEGFVKIIGVPSTGEIIGVEIFGKDACNLIGEATLAKTRGVKIEDWGRVVHGHPTLSEILQEACHIFQGTPIHSA
jgi:dihydrolipoamide dehydrogenase